MNKLKSGDYAYIKADLKNIGGAELSICFINEETRKITWTGTGVYTDGNAVNVKYLSGVITKGIKVYTGTLPASLELLEDITDVSNGTLAFVTNKSASSEYIENLIYVASISGTKINWESSGIYYTVNTQSIVTLCNYLKLVQSDMYMYLAGTDPNDISKKKWYAVNVPVDNNYKHLENIPLINGEYFLGNLDETKARTAVSKSGVIGGYDMCITDDTINAIWETPENF